VAAAPLALTGFSFPATVAFAGDGTALVAAGVIGPEQDWAGYDHYVVVRVGRVGPGPR
jgi:hypothetical protein